MLDGQFLDDDPRAVEAAEIAEADRRRAGLTPHEFACGAIEFQGMVRTLVAKAIGFGQTRRGFIESVASVWDEYFPAYQLLRHAQEQAARAEGEAKVTISQTFPDNDPDRVFVRMRADLAAATAPAGGMCPHGKYKSRSVECGAPPLDATVAGPAEQAPPAEDTRQRPPPRYRDTGHPDCGGRGCPVCCPVDAK